MTANALILRVLIAVAAVIYGASSGRAKAERLRELGRDLKAGRTGAWAILGLVAVISVWRVLRAVVGTQLSDPFAAPRASV